MGLILLSILLSLLLAAVVWLFVGSLLPPGRDSKWPLLANLGAYAAIILVPMYLTIFFTF
ncbi:MAG: hypothetical protein CMQ40_03720 [Gammaproteobacteria bacterium]|nr:hypothetical protein [Gammaproteobacteria bacterium]